MKIIAHRGASAYAPENTLSAFKKAVEMKAKALEFDVQMTKDNQLVVIHDYYLDRTTNGTGLIMEQTYDQIKLLDAGSWFHESFKDEKVPLLEDVLNLMPADMEIHIELKKLMFDKRHFEKEVLQMVKNKKLINQVIFSSFDHKTLKRLLELEKVKVGVLFGSNILHPDEYLLKEKLNSFSMNQSVEFISPELVEKIHNQQLKVLSYTVNQKDLALYLQNMKVDGIFSNYPDILA